MISETGTTVSGIVLAGGRSVRFGADKLALVIGGRPLVHRPIEALATVCDEVLVVVGAHGVSALPDAVAVPLRIVRDEEPGAGPLAGLLSGLEAALGSLAIVAAGDMPGLVPALLVELARRAGRAGSEAAALREGERVRPLPLALRRDVAVARARAIRGGGESSLRALLAALRVDEVSEIDWLQFDPERASLLDIDRPEDLARMRQLGRRPPAPVRALLPDE